MNLRRLPSHYRLILFALIVGDLIVLCLLVVVLLSSQNNKQVTPAVALSLPTRAVASVVPPTSTATRTPVATASPVPSRTPRPTNTLVVPRQAYNQPLVRQIVEKVPPIRGFESGVEVPFSLLSREQMGEEMRALYGVKEIQAEVNREWALYQALGLVPENMTIGDEQIDLYVSQIAGFYAPERKHIYIVTERTDMNIEDEVVFAHEYTHALQDQHFDLEAYLLTTTSTDQNMAVRAVVEGDATVVMALYAYGNTTQAQWDYLASQASLAEEPTLEMAGISENVRRILAFPYQEGASFVIDLLATGSWDGVNRAFADPPLSTEQVLHPEKYQGNRDLPQEIQLSADLGAGWQPWFEDTLGEFVLSVHLDEFLDDPSQAQRAAAGWDGDRIAAWRDGAGRALVLWQTVWDNDVDAAEFEEVYRAVIPARFEGALATADMWWEAPDIAVGVWRENDRVWVVWGPDRTAAQAALEMNR